MVMDMVTDMDPAGKIKLNIFPFFILFYIFRVEQGCEIFCDDSQRTLQYPLRIL